MNHKLLSAVEILFACILIGFIFLFGFRVGKTEGKKEALTVIGKQIDKIVYETTVSHIDSLRNDLLLIAGTSDSAKQSIYKRELEWFKSHLISRLSQ